MEELRQNKFAECQRPKYTGREDRDLIGHLFSPHDALAGMNQQAHFLATMEAKEVFVSSKLSGSTLQAAIPIPVPCYFPSQGLECRRPPSYLQPHLSLLCGGGGRGHCVTQRLRVPSDSYVCGSSK